MKELGDVHFMYGEFKLRSGDLAASREHLEKSREVRAEMSGKDVDSAILARDVGMSLYRLGNIDDLEKKPEAARKEFDEARKIAERLVKLSEGNSKRQVELMHALAHTGEVARASEIGDRLSAGPNVDREMRVEVARGYAQIARNTPPNSDEKVETAKVKAIESIRSAVKQGYRDHVWLETEPDLEPIRGRDDFKALLAEIPVPRT